MIFFGVLGQNFTRDIRRTRIFSGTSVNLIDDYLESAQWFNGEKQWAPLNNLVALEYGNETLRDNFSGNAAVCNPSYMPEFKDDYNKLCRIFKIRILTNDDFQKEKVPNCLFFSGIST